MITFFVAFIKLLGWAIIVNNIEFQFEFAFKDVSPLLGCWVFDLNVSSEE